MKSTMFSSRKKQPTFWMAIAYVLSLAAIFLGNLLVNGQSENPTAFLFRFPVLIALIWVIPRGPRSSLVVAAGFTSLAIFDGLSILVGDVDLALTLLIAVCGLVTAIRSYTKADRKTKKHIWTFLWILGVMVFGPGIFAIIISALVEGIAGLSLETIIIGIIIAVVTTSLTGVASAIGKFSRRSGT